MTLTMQDHRRRYAVLGELASLGVHQAQASKLLGISPTRLHGLLRIYGVSMQRKKAKERIPSERMIANKARNAEIMASFAAGDTLDAIGKRFGITRERVRQIAARHNVKPRRELASEARKQIVAQIAARNMSANEAAAEFGYSVEGIHHLCREYGVALRVKTPLYMSPEIAALAERVRAGESLRSASGGNHALASRLREYCQRMGIPCAHGRWRDFGPRASIVETLRRQGQSWDVISAAVSAVELIPIKTACLQKWAYTHMPMKGTPRVSPRNRGGAKRAPKPRNEPIEANSVKEAEPRSVA